jgi:predicted AAA+ superfamily ATPase
MKMFNTTGPCDPAYNHQLPPLERVPQLLSLIQQRQYVALSGPRQSGKTSVLRALVDRINSDG